MFGNRKNKIEEQMREFLTELEEQRQLFETGMTALEDGEQRVHADVCQVMENTNELTVYAMQNIEEESALIQSLDDFSKDLREAVTDYSQIEESVMEQLQSVTSLVEDNKHFTTPSKYLTEAPANLRQSYIEAETKLETMAEAGRKMSVMALNSAIEAGRMGETGKQFVDASENIRQTALDYEKMTLELKEQIEQSRERIDELEEVIHRMVALLKDSNMGTAKLLKKCQATEKMMKKSAMRDFSDDLILIRDKVVGMRNLDEEMAKCTERSKIQLSDIQEDISTRKKELTEMESDLSQLLDTLEERLGKA